MEILKVVETLQSESFDLVAYELGAPYAEAVNEAVSLLIAMGERIVDLEAELETLNATGLTPEELHFSKAPKMWKSPSVSTQRSKKDYYERR